MKSTIFAILAAIAAFAAPALAVPPESHIQHELRSEPVADWIKKARAEDSILVPVRIGLTQSNLHKGDEMLMDISSPESPNFGRHYTVEEVHDIFAPAEDRVNAVKGWLNSVSAIKSRPISLSANRQWLQFDAKIQELEALVHTQYHEYEHSETGKTTLGCDEYHVPKHIQEHIDYITPGVKAIGIKSKTSIDKRQTTGRTSGGPVSPKTRPLGVPVSDIQGENPARDCGFAITPGCIRTLYNVTDTVKGHPGNSLGVYEEGGELYSQGDLDDYFSTFAPNIPNGTHPQFDGVDGGRSPDNASYAGSEADLDFQASYPLVYPDEVVLYQVDDYYYSNHYHDGQGLFNSLLDAIDGSYCNYTAFGETGDDPAVDPVYPDLNPGGYNAPLQCGRYKPTNVISISYSADEPTLPLNYQRRQCNEFMKLGLQGVSIIVSTGDSGVAPRTDDCANNGTLFGPQSPINCPYITAVGATTLAPGSTAGVDKEIATTLFGSSGGFSNIFPQPKYQAAALKFYFDNYPPPYDYYSTTNNQSLGPGSYNRAGRGYPDVSATGQNFAGFYSGSTLISGTSVSTPVFAGLITRINSFRLDAGKKPIGFLNPTFYSNPDIFNDIVTGNNPGCGTNGFECVPAWDPVTGLGTPDYGKMKALLLSLP